MTITISVRDTSCRGCGLCVELCPTKVLALDDATGKATAPFAADCIGCLSCAYVCPSGSLTHRDVPMIRDFTRNLDNLKTLRRYL